jgi:hypothetical protein
MGQCSACLRRAGWTVEEVITINDHSRKVWQVTGVNGENDIRAEGTDQWEAWHRACEQAAALGMLGGVGICWYLKQYFELTAVFVFHEVIRSRRSFLTFFLLVLVLAILAGDAFAIGTRIAFGVIVLVLTLYGARKTTFRGAMEQAKMETETHGEGKD